MYVTYPYICAKMNESAKMLRQQYFRSFFILFMEKNLAKEVSRGGSLSRNKSRYHTVGPPNRFSIYIFCSNDIEKSRICFENSGFRN